MGNSNQNRRLQDDFDATTLRGQSITFHSLHSDSIRISHDSRMARRINGFRGICFSSRPICVFERIYIRIVDVVSVSQSVGREGVLRVGLLSDNPSHLNTADLPTYASPDITYEQGYWAKAVPEALARQGNVLFFYVTTNGDVIYGLNGKEMGVFFGGVQTDLPLWALMDLYGSTSCLELVDGFQISHYNSYTPAPIDTSWPPSAPPSIPDVAPFYPLPVNSTPSIIAPAWPSSSVGNLPIIGQKPAALPSGDQAVLEIIDPMPFHINCGRNVFFSHNFTVASRERNDYCNGYVFTSRPLVPGEKLVVSILSITNEYSGGLAFGMTSCNPNSVNKSTLPDDSDFLLDFPDYWVVHKDVYTKPEINDELTFHLALSGEVFYMKNGCRVGTLMHVDTTLPLWAFFDIYGSTQQIKSLGVITPVALPLSSTTRSLTICKPASDSKDWEIPVSLNPNSTARLPPTVWTGTLNENHTLHRSTVSSPKLHTASVMSDAGLSDSISTLSFGSGGTRPRHVSELDRASRRHSSANEPPPALPPKLSQNRSFSIAAPSGVPVGTVALSRIPSTPAARPSSSNPVVSSSSSLDAMLKASDVPVSLPPPLIPVPGKPAVASKPAVKPTRPQRRADLKAPSCAPVTGALVPSRGGGGEPGQECVVCMEQAANCALYTCGHMCMCYECAVDIVKNQGGLCPICREPIKDIIKIFKS